MPTTTLGVWTPDDSDDWDLTVDLAATGVSVDSAIIGAQTARRGLAAGRPAFGQEGRTYYATDTDILWYDTGAAWKNRTPGILCQVVSSTGLINGTATMSWTNSVADSFLDTRSFFNAGSPTILTMPYTGSYEVAHSIRGNGTAPITANPIINGGAVNGYRSSSATGAAGAATHASRVSLINLTAGDTLSITATSTAVQLGTHNFLVKFLGDFS